jgi:aryl-alcohol dehydrogenase-like predicted oxidoreductase
MSAASTSGGGQTPIAASGTILLGDFRVHRLGYGSMRLAGPDAWGPVSDEGEAIRAVRRAVELGVDFIDTADSYGPFYSEQVLKKALHPYPDGLVIATKAGHTRPGPTDWVPVGRREYIRQQCHLSLRHLGVERLDILQVHRLDLKVPLEEQFGTLQELQDEGLVRHVGLSNVTIEQATVAREAIELVCIQNPYSLARREHEPLVDLCEEWGIAFIPWAPIAAGRLTASAELAECARELGATPAQLALAWLLRRSATMLPIPGSASAAHVEENCRAAELELTDADVERVGVLLGRASS